MKKLIRYFLLLCLFAATVGVQSCRKEKDPVKTPLAVKSFFPNSGNGGTLVTILGSGFNNEGSVKVSFAGKDADIINRQDTVLVVRAPATGGSGAIRVNLGEQSAEAGNYTYQKLSVKQFFPGNGPAGMHIRISGEGFSSLDSPAEVLVNGKSATIVSATDTLIVAEVPVAAGSGPVTVKVDGKSSSGAGFRFQAITGIKPVTGGAGTKVVISGGGFENVLAGNVVDFNGKPAVVKEAAENRLVVEVPADVRTGPVSVVINDQKTTGPDFTIVPLPTISGVTPLSGPAGTEMTITGLHFSKETDENIVKINGTVVPVKSATGTKLTLVLPGGTGVGKVTLSVNDQAVTGPEFRDQQLGILSVTPANGLAGTKVTLAGTGFSTIPAENIVTFNGILAMVESATETSITVTAPAALTSGPLVVKRAALEARAPQQFMRAGVITIAGGPATNTLLTNTMNGMAVDSKGNIFVIDRSQFNVLKVTPDGQISVFAGSDAGEMGVVDGKGTAARFMTLRGIVIDPNDNIYVTEVATRNNIRKIKPDGTVTTFKSGLERQPGQIILDKKGNMYVSQLYWGMLKIYPDAAVEQAFNGSVSDDCRPAVDAQGNLYYYVDENEGFLGKWNFGGAVEYRWLGSSFGHQDGPFDQALFMYGMRGLLFDADGNMLILDKANYSIRKANLATREVSTVAKLGRGFEDGSFEQAKFSFSTVDMATDRDGNIYLLDAGNKAIRKVMLK